jgi:hypothetical protein
VIKAGTKCRRSDKLKERTILEEINAYKIFSPKENSSQYTSLKCWETGPTGEESQSNWL